MEGSDMTQFEAMYLGMAIFAFVVFALTLAVQSWRQDHK
jgi:hypothetical protein